MRKISFATIVLTIVTLFVSGQFLIRYSEANSSSALPIPVDEHYTGVAARGQANPGILRDDVDPNGGNLVVHSIASYPQHGTLTYFGPYGSFNYNPSTGYTGDDSFTYNVCNNTGCAVGTQTLHQVNTAPNATGESYSSIAARKQTFAQLLANDSDVDNDTIDIVDIQGVPAGQGRLSVITNNREIFYTNNNGDGTSYIGTTSYSYKVCDTGGACSSRVNVTLNGNSAPSAVGEDDLSVGIWEAFRDTLLENDSDSDGDEIQIGGVVSQPQNGIASYNVGTGVMRYEPNPANYTGWDSFEYKVCDTQNACSNATINLYIFAAAGDQDAGANACHFSVGKPVNVTNGNMYLSQTDYSLNSVGYGINITRTYNSVNQSTGLFGTGWTSQLDEYVTQYTANTLRLQIGDGKGIYFGRTSTTAPFKSVTSGFYGEIVKNTNGTFTLTMKDGSSHSFDASGRLTSLKDRNNNQTTLNYDTNYRLVSIIDHFNRTVNVTTDFTTGKILSLSDSTGTIATYDYGANGRLNSVTYPDGSKYTFSYILQVFTGGSRLLLTEVKDALQNILEKHEYYSDGKASTSEVAGANEKYTLNYGGTITTVTDGLGRISKYTIGYAPGNNLRRVVTTTEGLCGCGGSGTQTTNYKYDYKLNLIKKTDALGKQTRYTYDAKGNPLTISEVKVINNSPVNFGTETYTYNSFGEILTRTDRMGGVTTNTYDASGNLLTSKDALNNTTTLTYNTRGQLVTVKDARNNTTTLIYDTVGKLTQVKDANNKLTNYAYDARLRLTSWTNALNETNSIEYDLHNRPKKVTFPDTKFVTYNYDLAGRKTSVIDARGNTTSYGYDAAYRLTSMTDPLNHTITYGYDAMSNLTTKTDALNQTTNYEYDDFNRLKKTIYPPASVGATRLEESMTYDVMGNVKTRIDTAGRQTVYDYDDEYRLIKTTDALSQITQFEYNQRDQMTKVKDALNQEYVFAYDALGRQLSQTRAGSTMSFEYDAIGNRTKRTDYMGRETTYEYDVLNRLKKINYLSGNQTPNLTATYTYDDLSRLATAVNENGSVSFTYDNRGRVKTSTDVFGHVIEYGYDANGNRNQLKLDSNIHTTYAYDVANRLTTLTDEANQNFTFGYDIANRLISKTLPNSITTTYDYDGMNRLARLKDASSTATLFDRQYSYNNANQISQITEPTQVRNFGYDNVDRLTSMTNGTNTESYAFDAVGNRNSSHRSATYAYQPFNKLIATASANYNYDQNGNMTVKMEGSNFWRYSWDYENRMTMASTRKQTVRYKYDALGRRIQRYTVGVKENTKFIYDGMDVVADDNFGTLTKYQNGLGIDNKLKLVTNGTSKYFVSDHLGSTNALTDSSGAILEQTAYDSFGNATTNLSTRYQYTGREYDSFSGLHYYRARWYDGKLGRFISEDPIGFAGGDVNLFGYVRNRPLMFTDPTGLIIPLPVITAGVGAAAGFIGSIVGKGINNYRCGKSFFDGIDTPEYWTDVAIATAGGAVVGALMPFAGTSYLGAAGLGAGGNVAQYFASAGLGRTKFSWSGLFVSAATGAVGGLVGGTFTASKPWSNGFLTSPAEAALFKAANNEAAIKANTGVGTLLRNGIGGAVGNAPNPLDPCSCE